ncbi:MAG: RNA pseudouridine synthase [Prevotellaceae bacterium]|nr:RNA pseudouridine synthase [Prevotellaceae bacterium]
MENGERSMENGIIPSEAKRSQGICLHTHLLGSSVILYEDNHILAVNKRAGEIVQGDKTGDTPLCELLKQFIKERDHKPGNVFLGVPHRLDRPVSGVTLFAKTGKALERLNELFRNGGVHKIYWAIVKNPPAKDSDTLTHYLIRNEKQNKSYASGMPRQGAKEARLRYSLLAGGDNYHLLEVQLLTGRHHQIRCQLAAVGCPVKGDLKYGAPRSNPDGSISLHARSVAFEHPVKKEPVVIVAPAPADALWQWFEQRLGGLPQR